MVEADLNHVRDRAAEIANVNRDRVRDDPDPKIAERETTKVEMVVLGDINNIED